MLPGRTRGRLPRPARPMGFVSAWALGVGTMVGAGIFSLSGDAARHAGPGAILSYVAAGAAAFVLAVNLGRLAALRPVSGGPYVYIRDALGPAAALVAGWQLWLGAGLSVSFYCLGFARYLAHLLRTPEHEAGPGCVLLVGAVNAMGPGWPPPCRTFRWPCSFWCSSASWLPACPGWTLPSTRRCCPTGGAG